MDLLEECAQLQVLFDFMDEFDALVVVLLSEEVELLDGPIVEKLKELDVFG